MKKLLIPLAAVVLCAAILFGMNAGFASVRAENAGSNESVIIHKLLICNILPYCSFCVCCNKPDKEIK